MKGYFGILLDEMEKEFRQGPQAFTSSFNQGGRNRTELMLGTGANRDASLVWRAARTHAQQKGWVWDDVSFERYHDLLVWRGNCQQGDQYPELICEVENGPDILCTMTFLLRTQCPRKSLVMYFDATPDFRDMVERDVTSTLSHFHTRGYQESPNTEYVLIFGPRQINASGNSFPRADWRAMYFCSPPSNQRPTFLWL